MVIGDGDKSKRLFSMEPRNVGRSEINHDAYIRFLNFRYAHCSKGAWYVQRIGRSQLRCTVGTVCEGEAALIVGVSSNSKVGFGVPTRAKRLLAESRTSSSRHELRGSHRFGR
jgi:hypothetical protein